MQAVGPTCKQGSEGATKARAREEQKRAEPGRSEKIHLKAAITLKSSQSNTASVCPWRNKRGLKTRLWEDRNINLLQTAYTLNRYKIPQQLQQDQSKRKVLRETLFLLHTGKNNYDELAFFSASLVQLSLVCSHILFKLSLAKKMWHNHCSLEFTLYSECMKCICISRLISESDKERSYKNILYPGCTSCLSPAFHCIKRQSACYCGPCTFLIPMHEMHSLAFLS